MRERSGGKDGDKIKVYWDYYYLLDKQYFVDIKMLLKILIMPENAWNIQYNQWPFLCTECNK